MARRYKTNFRRRIRKAIDAREGNIILRSDLNGLGLPRQVSRALKALVEDGVLIKLGYGIYAKAKKSKYTNRTVLLDAFESVCVEALKRLGIRWELGQALKDYNEGKTQQVPVKFIIRLKDRYRGSLDDGSRILVFEDKINAR
jgi:hypothetical protein